MANVQPVLLQDEDGTTDTIFVETTTLGNLPPLMPPAGELDEDDRESYGITEDAVAGLDREEREPVEFDPEQPGSGMNDWDCKPG